MDGAVEGTYEEQTTLLFVVNGADVFVSQHAPSNLPAATTRGTFDGDDTLLRSDPYLTGWGFG